jgi:secondary thiamine-phosphate synthase enzyme
MIYKITLKTRSREEFQDITDRVSDAVKESGVEDGLCVVYVPHTTAAVTINEHADPDVVADIIAHLEKMVPRQAGYKHGEGNASAHIKAALIGTSATVPVQYGELALGTWQGIFFCEFDGPRSRDVTVKVIPDNE